MASGPLRRLSIAHRDGRCPPCSGPPHRRARSRLDFVHRAAAGRRQRGVVVSARLSRRASLVLLAVGLVVTAFVVYRSYSRQPANAEGLPGKRDVPYLDGKWIRYSADYAKRAEVTFSIAEKS